jgi:hypothetical protein
MTVFRQYSVSTKQPKEKLYDKDFNSSRTSAVEANPHKSPMIAA